MKTDLFQSCGHCWVFQIGWRIECSTFTASPFRIWNSSTGIPSPPLALFVVMLPKAHLTLHSRMSDSRWVITPLWLCGSWRSFLYCSSVCSWASLVAQRLKRLPEFARSAGDLGSIPGSGRSLGEGNGNPLQYSCLENPMDGGAWWSTVHGVAKSQTLLSDFTFCVFLPPLNIFFCEVHTISVLYCTHLCMKWSLVISDFLEEISSLSHCIVFLYFFALITEEGFLISPCCSLELCIQMGISILFSFAFSFSSFLSCL